MAMLKDSLITGDLRVTGTIYGKATNAVLADEATAVRDKGNGTLTYLNYGAAGMSTTSWIGSWDGYTLKAISPTNLKTTMALNNVENTKLSTWAGSGNITTIGTLTSGTVPWARLSGVPSSFTPAAHNHDSSYVNITGDTMTGQLKTSFKSSVAMGTYKATATTVEDLCEELRYSSGAAGSANITTAYTKDGVTIATKWYNFLWVPHRSGGVNGAASGDNCDYGSLYLSGMTGSGLYMIRYANKAIAEVKDLYKDTTYGAEKGISLSSGKFGHSNTAITAQTTQALYPIKIDAYGHITGYGTAVTSLPASDVYSWAKASTKPTYTYSEVGAAAANHNHDSSYVNVSGDTMTGALTLSGDPTSAKHAATKQYVDQSFAANDAMIFKGTIGSSGATVTALPATHNIGWTYRVLTAGTYAGVKCEIGDLIICITDGTSANNAHWTIAQTNIDGAVIGPASATSGNIALFDGTTGKLIKNSSYSPSSFATSGHTHTTSLASDTGTSTVTLTSGGKYKLTAGGNSVIFTMPTSNNYTHPTSAGNKHIPSGGEDGQILAYGGSSGTAKWETLHLSGFYCVGSDGTNSFDHLTQVTSWTTNTPTQVTKKTVVTNATVSNEVLTLTTGDSVTVTAGTAASLNYNNYALWQDYHEFYDHIGDPIPS